MFKYILLGLVLLSSSLKATPFSLGLDTGVLLTQTNEAKKEKNISDREKIIENLGWNNVKGTAENENTYPFVGLYGEFNILAFLSVGFGYKFLNLGTTSYKVNGDFGSNYIKLTQAESLQVDDFYLYTNLFIEENKFIFGLIPELGISNLSMQGSGTLSGYNGTVISEYVNYEGKGTGLWAAINIYYGIKFTKHLLGKINLGANTLNFHSNKITNVNSSKNLIGLINKNDKGEDISFQALSLGLSLNYNF